MSSLPSRPLPASLPPRPTTTVSSIISQNHTSTTAPKSSSNSNSTPSLLSRITHALPPRPPAAALPPSDRSRSPVKDSYASRDAYEPRGLDTYRPRSRSRTPEREREWSRDAYIPASPSRHDWDRADVYFAPRSPSPVPVRSRRYSDRARTPVSPVKRYRSPSPERPASFYTSSYRRSEASAEKQGESSGLRYRSDREHAESRTGYRDRQSRAEDSNRSSRAREHSTLKRPPSPSYLGEPSYKAARHTPTSPHRAFSGSSGLPRLSATLSAAYGPRSVQTASFSTHAPSANRSHSSNSVQASRFDEIFTGDDPNDSSHSLRHRRSRSHSPNQHGSMTPRGRGGSSRGRGASRPARGKPVKRIPEVEGPVMNEATIVATVGQGASIKQVWLENPKSPLANHYGGAAPEAKYAEVMIDGQQYVRATISNESGNAIGDAKTQKEAARLAALNMLLQLMTSGALSQKGDPNAGSNGAGGGGAAGQGDTAKLSDGTEIGYERARQFMDYYCNKYKFGKPDIEYHQTSLKRKKGKGPSLSEWEAVMTVGGRRIGMGSAATKKGAQTKCYLDVTQYLEGCDNALWLDFVDKSKNDTSAIIGLAPHLVFQMSDHINEDIYGLCGDIRNSSLHRNAPPPNIAAEEQQLPPWQGSRVSRLSPAEMEVKSKALQDKLTAYQVDPAMDRMRAQRDALPVKSKASELLAKIECNDVTIIMAATGSGKTTQVPQLLFDDYINRGQGAKCNILCTQPRRLAATSVAERIADERGDRLGGEIGYQVRFDTKLPQPNGSITFCTTGIFLRRMQSSLGTTANPQSVAAMDQITHIVVDEVHERDIDTDLSLVVLKQLLADRKARGIPLKVVLMSATIDPTLFQKYFTDDRGRLAPVAEVPGRTFPVEKHWLNDIVPALQTDRGVQWVFKDKKNADYLNRELSADRSLFGPDTGMDLPVPYSLVALTIAHVLRESDDGHVLVFLPGWDEIKKVADVLMDPSSYLYGLRFNDSSKYSIHYLHSTIPAAEQREVFKPPPKGVRRIILATNIAETSITIPDVVYVVDTGRVKEKRYDPDRHMSSLVSAWVGQSNLNQRAGRAGRHREGLYFGLVSNNRYNSLNPHQTVEMKRSDLSNVVMHVKALNLGGVEEVLAATIEPPAPPRIVTAMQTLRMLGAMDPEQNLTSLGRVLLQLPVEAAIGKLCLFGSFFRCLDSALTLAAVLTNRDPFLAPLALRKEAQDVKDSWSPVAFRSDPLAIVAAYNAWNQFDERGDYRRGTDFCSENFLSKATLLQIKQVKKSLLQSLDQTGVIAVSAGGAVSRLRRRDEVPAELNVNGNSLPLLAALIAMASAPNFAIRTSEKSCRTAQDKTVFISTSSVNARRREQGGPEVASSSFNPAEKRIYAFGEKSNSVPLGGNAGGGMTQLRNTTRLDPMTYMLFGAFNLKVTQSGLQCDNWLPVAGNLQALDDIQRLKTLFDGCMLRVFEGVGKSLVRGRDQRMARNRESVKVAHNGSSHIVANNDDADQEGSDGADEAENESDDDDDAEVQKRVVEPLKVEEIRELELLTTDVVKILDAYAAEREGGSTYASRPVTPSFDPPRGPSGGAGGGGVYQRGGFRGGYGGASRGGPIGGGRGGFGSYGIRGGHQGQGQGAGTGNGQTSTAPERW